MEGGSPHSSSKVPRSPAYVPVPADEAEKLSKDELLSKLKMMQSYVSYLEEKSGEPSGIEEKLKMHQQEASRRESVLLMRLAAKEHEMLDYLNQNQDLKQAKTPSSNQMQEMLLDPAVNLLFEKMKAELTDTKEKLEQAQNDLSAWKFTPDSVTGKKLMAKCRTLIQENQELGRQLSQGRIAQLEAELSLQKKYSEELKESQDELNDFVIQLDEEVEGMQSTICVLQQQLKEAKATIDKISEENRLVRERLQEIQPDSYVVPRSFTQENDLSRTVKSEADAYSGIVSPLIMDNGSVATRLSPQSLSNDGDAQNEAKTVTECDGRLASLQDDSHPACGRSLRPVKPRHSPSKASQHLLAYKLEQASTPEMKPDFVLTSLASAAPSLAESEANIEAISSVSYDNYSCQAVLPSSACNKFEADSLSEHAQVFEPPSPTFPTTCSEQLRETRHRLVSPPSNEGSSRHVDNYSGCSDDVETRQSTETGPCEEQLGSQEMRRIKAIICPLRASSSAKHSAFSISNLLKEESHLKLNASASESVDAQTHDHVQSAENASNGVIEDCAL